MRVGPTNGPVNPANGPGVGTARTRRPVCDQQDDESRGAPRTEEESGALISVPRRRFGGCHVGGAARLHDYGGKSVEQHEYIWHGVSMPVNGG